jgi:hypothetical protein
MEKGSIYFYIAGKSLEARSTSQYRWPNGQARWPGMGTTRKSTALAWHSMRHEVHSASASASTGTSIGPCMGHDSGLQCRHVYDKVNGLARWWWPDYSRSLKLFATFLTIGCSKNLDIKQLPPSSSSSLRLPNSLALLASHSMTQIPLRASSRD